MTTIGTTQMTNQAMAVAAVSRASPERNDAAAGPAAANKQNAAARRATPPRALRRLERATLTSRSCDNADDQRAYGFTSFQPGPGSNTVILAPISAVPLPRSF